MGREASVTFFTSESEKCPCSLFATEKDNCCTSTHELLKLESSQKTLSTFHLDIPALIFLGALFDADIDDAAVAPSKARVPADAQPPPKILYQLHCSLVFYDKMTIA
jgi:hypothetical protein